MTMVSMNSFEILPLDPSEGAQDMASANFTFIQDIAIPHAEPPQSDSSEWESTWNSRFEELLSEIASLKEKMEHNNKIAQKFLDETISSWQKTMEKTKIQHQSELTAATENTQKLLAENEELSKMVTELKDVHDQLKEFEELKKKLSDSVAQKERLEEVVKEQETKHQVLQEQITKLTNDLYNLKLEFSLLEEEKEDFKKAYLSLQEKQQDSEQGTPEACNDLHVIDDEDANGYAVVMQSEINGKKKDAFQPANATVLETELSKSKAEHLSYQLEEEIHMSKNLMQLLGEKDTEIQKLKEINEKMITMNDKATHKEKELEELSEKLVSAISAMEECKTKADNSFVQLSELEEKLKATEELLAAEKSDNQRKSEALSKAEEELRKLNEEKENMSIILEQTHEQLEDEEGQLSQARAEIEQQSLIRQDGLTARICHLEYQLETERQNVAALTRQLTSNDGHSTSEPIRILKAQVDMYRSDYESEKAARASAEAEIEKLKKIVNDLQKQEVYRLHKQEKFRNHTSNYFSRSRRKEYTNGRSSEPAVANHEQDIPDMTCPCCYCKFSTFADLERHVLICMEKH